MNSIVNKLIFPKSGFPAIVKQSLFILTHELSFSCLSTMSAPVLLSRGSELVAGWEFSF